MWRDLTPSCAASARSSSRSPRRPAPERLHPAAARGPVPHPLGRRRCGRREVWRCLQHPGCGPRLLQGNFGQHPLCQRRILTRTRRGELASAAARALCGWQDGTIAFSEGHADFRVCAPSPPTFWQRWQAVVVRSVYLLAVSLDQAGGRRVVRHRRLGGALEFAEDLGGEYLAQLDAPLVERVDVPDGALGEH